MTKRYLMSILLGILFVNANAQQQERDSIRTLILKNKADSAKIPLWMEMHKTYLGEDEDSALYCLDQAKTLIEKTGVRTYDYECSYAFAKIYHAGAKFGDALEYTKRMKGAALREKDRFREAFSYRTLFNIFHNLNDNDSAVFYAIKSIELTKEINDTFNISTNYANLCWLYMDLSQYDKAREYGEAGVRAGMQYKDTTGLLIALNNLALSYHRTGQNEKAIPLFTRQLEIARKVNKKRSIERALINLATCNYAIGNVPALRDAVEQLNTQLETSPNKDTKIKAYQLTVNAYMQISEKQFSKAEETLLAGIEIAKKDSILDPLLGLYQTMAKLKAAQHDFPASERYEIMADDIHDLFQQEELSAYGLQLEKKYETEKKDALIHIQQAELKYKTVMNYMLIGGSLILLALAALLYRNFLHRQKIQQQRINELELEKQLLASEAVLKGEEKERTRLAKDLHDGLGGMLSGIKFSLNAMRENLVMTPENAQSFERSIDMLDSSIHEMRRVAHNLMPEVLLKFGLDAALQDFCGKVSKSGALEISYKSIGLDGIKLDQSRSVTIYRVIQELINNTLKHASASRAIVQVSLQDDQLAVTVEDNGKGFDPSASSAGIGLNNIRNRVEFLKGEIDISSKPGEGVSAFITIPVREELRN